MKIQPVEESAFKEIDGSRRIIVHDFPHQFAILDLGEPLGCYGLSWRSSPIIQPEMELSADGQTLWIGVDERVAAIDLQDGHVRIALSLVAPLFQILVVEEFTAILTELEVIVFHNSTWTIQCSRRLPDLSESILFNGSDFVVQLFDGPPLTLNPRTGKFKESPEEYFAESDRLQAEKQSKDISAA